MVGKPSLEIFRGLCERSFWLVEFAPFVAVHDDDCLSAPVEPSSGFLFAEEVCPSADEVEGFGDLILPDFGEEFAKDVAVG